MKKYSVTGLCLLAVVLIAAVLWIRVIYIPCSLVARPVETPVHVPFVPVKMHKALQKSVSDIHEASSPGTTKVKNTDDQTKNSRMVKGVNLLKNGSFADQRTDWQFWQAGKEHTSAVSFKKDESIPFLRIENPQKKLIGIQQLVSVLSGQVYRLSGQARSMNPRNNSVIFGGRIGIWLPPQKEREIVWMTEYDKWLPKELVFTNHVTGKATVYVHMGYGGVASTGEFTNIKLELLVPAEPSTEKLITGSESEGKQNTPGKDTGSNSVYRISRTGSTSRYASVLQALRKTQNDETVIIMPGIYKEKNAGSEWIMTTKRNVHIKGIGNPEIIIPANDKFYQIGMQLPNNNNLTVEGITLYSPVYINNNHIVYGAVFTGGNSVLLSNCTFKAELFGTNTTFKNVVAINGAKNITVMDCSIITRDLTGMNKASHVATHGSKDSILLTNTLFSATTLETFSVGPAHFINCTAEKEYSVNGFTISGREVEKEK